MEEYKRLFDYEFDFKTYIAKRLREIDDLEERKFAKAVLEDGLLQIIERTEEKYKDMEKAVAEEYPCPGKGFEIYITLLEKGRETEESRCLFPVAPGGKEFFYRGGYSECERFFASGRVFAGTITTETGTRAARFTVRRSEKYLAAAARLYRLYEENRIPWTTLNLAYLTKFFEAAPERTEDAAKLREGAAFNVDFAEFAPNVKSDLLPVWNVRAEKAASGDFMTPCPDERAWEHTIPLNKCGVEHAYLFFKHSALLSYHRSGGDLFVKTSVQEMPDLQMVKIAALPPAAKESGVYPLLSNERKDSFTRRFLGHTGVQLKTRADIFRKINELDFLGTLAFLDMEVIEDDSRAAAGYSMNPFAEESLFAAGKRRVLLLRFKRLPSPAAWLAEDMMSFAVSELQREFPEFLCKGSWQ